MKTVVLVSCSAGKISEPAPAEELYSSDLFNKQLAYAKKLTHPKDIYIISAKYHLLPLRKVIAPYNVTLNDMSSNDQKQWASVVLEQLQKRNYDLQKDKFIFLAGTAYRQYLEPHMKHVEVPLAGLRIGQQKKALIDKLKETINTITKYIINELKKLL
jgi:hypothetical protein